MHFETRNWLREDPEQICTTILHTPWFEIKNRSGFYSLEYGTPQVVILPVIDGEKILLVRIKRPLILDEPWELPAGGGENGESPVETAQRELQEETGLSIKDMNRFKNTPMLSELPGRSPELLTCFHIDISSSEFTQRGDFDDEVTQLKLYNFDTIRDSIVSGEIYLSSVIAILSRFLLQKGLKR